MKYETRNSPDTGQKSKDRQKADELISAALDELEVQMQDMRDAGATGRVEALCRVIQTLGGVR